MNEQHTPGPWIARKDPSGGRADWCVGLEADNVPIDYVAVCWDRDAHLIAAAPDILAALKYARRFVNASEVDIAFIDAAIARALPQGAPK